MMVAGFDVALITTLILIALCVLELGLTAFVASETWSPDSLNFTIFCSVWSPLVLFYAFFSPKFLPQFYHKLVAVGLLAVTTIFWFAAAIATAAWLGAPRSCSKFAVCGSFQAAIAFAWFIWVGFSALTILEVMRMQRDEPSTFQLRGKSVAPDASVSADPGPATASVDPHAAPYAPAAPPATYPNQPAGQPQQPPYPNV